MFQKKLNRLEPAGRSSDADNRKRKFFSYLLPLLL